MVTSASLRCHMGIQGPCKGIALVTSRQRLAGDVHVGHPAIAPNRLDLDSKAVCS